MGYGEEIVAIDIGSNKMKFVHGIAKRNGIKIKNMFYAATPNEAINNGEIVDIGLMREALTVAVKSNKLGGKPTVVTIQSSTFISREFTIPLMKNPVETESALRFEVEQFMPINVEEYVLSYRELERLGGDKEKKEKGKKKTPVKVRYFVGLMTRRMVASYYELLRAVKLRPIGMDVNFNAIDKLLRFDMYHSIDKSFASETILTADIGHDAMDMTIFENGMPQINRTVPIGGAEITRAISSAIGLDHDEAEIKKIQSIDMLSTGTSMSFEDATINDTAKLIVGDWIEQMRRMLDYYYTTRTGKSVDRIYLYGGSSTIKGLSEHLKATLGISVRVIEPPGKMKIKKSSPAPMCTFMNAIGAIIRK